jgi:hypothetical protein
MNWKIRHFSSCPIGEAYFINREPSEYLWKDGTIHWYTTGWLKTGKTELSGAPGLWATWKEANDFLKEWENKQKSLMVEPYKIGDIFDNTWGHKENVVMLHQAPKGKVGVVLIGSWRRGEYWSPPKKVEDLYKISQEELDLLLVPGDWVKRKS